MNSVFLLHLSLGKADELAHVFRRRAAEIDEDVRVDVGDLRVADAVALETTLVDESPRSDSFDLLEDAARARVPIEPWMLPTAPAEVFLHDAVKDGWIAPRQAKGGREHDISPMVEDGVVVTEVDVIGANGSPLIVFTEDLARLEYLGDEHRAFALGCGRQKVQILPDGTANGARDAHVVLESRPAAAHRLQDEILDDGSALGPQRAMVAVLTKLESSCGIANDEAAKSLVADEDVGAESKDEIWNVELACDQDGIRELVGGASFEVEVGWAADAKSRVWREELVATQSRYSTRCDGLASNRGELAGGSVEAITQLLTILSGVNGAG